MNKELELEAEKYKNSFISKKEATKQKLEFAIKQLRECKKGAFNTAVNKIKELEQRLKEL